MGAIHEQALKVDPERVPGEEDQHFVAVVEDVAVGFVLVAEGAEELAEPPPLLPDARRVPALARERRRNWR